MTWRAIPGRPYQQRQVFQPRQFEQPVVRGLHSFTSQLNLSAAHGTGGARRGCVARVKGVLEGGLGCVGCFCVRHGSS